MITGNESATGYGFCTANGESHQEQTGLTIRQHFAGIAMQGFIAAGWHQTIEHVQEAAKRSVAASDALIAELNKPKP